jgi:hypothetical protein
MRRHMNSPVTNRVRHFRPVEPLMTPSVRHADAWRVRSDYGIRIANLRSLSRMPAPESAAVCKVPSRGCAGEVPGGGPSAAVVYRTGGSRQGTANSARGPSIARRFPAAPQHPRRRRSSGGEQRSGNSPCAALPPLAALALYPARGREDGPAPAASLMRRSVRHPRRRDTHEERNVDQRPPAGGKPDCHH